MSSTSINRRASLLVGILFLGTVGLAGVSAAPRPKTSAKRATTRVRPKPAVPSAREQFVRERLRLVPHLNSVSALAKQVAWRRQNKIRARTNYMDAYLWRLRHLAHPFDRVDWSAWDRARAHRDRMRPAVLAGPGGARRPAVVSGNRWQFLGPNNLASPLAFFSSGPFSGRVNGVAYDPNASTSTYWAAASTGGVWKTTNAGQSWTFMSQSWPALETNAIAIHPTQSNTVYAGTGDFRGFGAASFGMMKTTDGGANWTNLGRADFGGTPVSRIAIDPETPETITIATGRGQTLDLGRVWRSTNGGQAWTAVIPTLQNWSDIDIGARDSNGARVYYAVGERIGGSGGQIWRSRDRGATWSQLTRPTGTTLQLGADVAASLTAPNTVYLIDAFEKKVFKSTDAGDNWTDSTSGFPNGTGASGLGNWDQFFYDYFVACSTRTDASGAAVDVVYVGLIDLAQSNDGGATWTTAGRVYESDARIHPDQHTMAVNPRNPNEVLIGCDGGVYRLGFTPSTNSFNFASLNRSIGITQFYRADFHPTDENRMLGGTQDNSTPVALGDLQNWGNVFGGDGAGCAINQRNPNIQYGSTQFQGIFRTDTQWSGAITFIRPGFGTDRLPFIGRITLDPSNPNLLYAGTNFLWRWNDPNSAWQSRLGGKDLATGRSNNRTGTILAIAVAPSDSNTIYVGSDVGDLYASTDAGTTWAEIASGVTGLPDRAVSHVAVHPTNPRSVVVTLSGLGVPHVWRCADVQAQNRTWVNVSGAGLAGLPDIPANALALDPTDPQNRWYVGTEVGVFRTTTGGSAWENMTGPLGLPNVRVDDLKVTGTGWLMAATHGRGMWRINPRAAVQSVTLTAPNGGTPVLVGRATDITWTSDGFSPPHNVKLELSRDSGVTWSVIVSSTPDDGSFSWTPTAPTVTTARIRITSLSDPAANDTSDADFSIVDGSLVITSPDGGDVLRLADRVKITWTVSGAAQSSPRVKIELSRDGGAAFSELFASVDNDGEQDWTVVGPATKEAIIRITPITQPVFADDSDEFEIRERSVLNVTAPNGGEVLVTGKIVTIRWTSAGFPGAVNIDLSRNGGRDWSTLFSGTANDGAHAWTVTGPPTSLGRVRVSSVLEPNVFDTSNGVFAIEVPGVDVTAPAAAQTALVGRPLAIAWTTTGIPATGGMRIELSRDGARTWQTISASTPNDGAYSWIVSGTPSSAAVIRVASAGDPAVRDLSANFTIAAPTIFVVRPNGGERWRVGSQETIEWSGTTVGDGTVNIQLSRDDGSTWTTIITGTVNDGAEAWGVRTRTSRRARLRVVWTPIPSVTDTSDRAFRISAARRKRSPR